MYAARAGILYVVATPVGNLGDMSPRAVEVLSSVDVIAAEDTRHSAVLLRHFGIKTPCIALHEHNERQLYPSLIKRLQEGQSIAIISDAGTPLISDPGYVLVREAHRQGVRVSPVPGPSALMAALSAAGLPTDRFAFEGFLPVKPVARRERLEALKTESRTLAFYEAPHRILDTLKEMTTIFGAEREAVIARELSKTFETVHADTLAGLSTWTEADSNQQKGEFVILVHGAAEEGGDAEAAEAERVLRILAAELPLSQAVALSAKITGVKKNRLYKAALEIGLTGE